MNIYIHYNGLDLGIPETPRDFWHNYEEVNMARMFLIAAESWERNGWEVKRIRGAEPGSGNKSFNFSGVLAKQAKFYPERFWNWWLALEKVAPCWTAVASVVNFGFGPELAETLQGPVHYGEALNLMQGFEWASPCFYVTKGFIHEFTEIVKRIDAGKLARESIPNVYTDEHVVRDFLTHRVHHFWTMDNAKISTEAHKKTLLHFPRSGVRRAMELYPPVCQ